MIQKPKIKQCPVCNTNLSDITIYWCNKCNKWYEDIDFLDSKIEVDEDCKECKWLAETTFKKNGLTIFICNNMKSKSIMEKMRDFRRCSEFEKKDEENVSYNKRV